jgi:peptidoglycan/LPS O-acetylase OafA/YrhL
MSAATPFAKTQASVHLDAIRGLAAVVVLLTHWRALLFVDYAGLAHQEKILAAPLYLASQGGHLAVDIFFVLSGYLITGSVIRNLGKGTFTLLDYGSHRLIRLWTVLLPSLVVGGLFDWIG